MHEQLPLDDETPFAFGSNAGAKLVLRDYQKSLVEKVRWQWVQGERSVIAWLPTGGGKTEISVFLAQVEADAGGCTLFVVDRKTLVGQARTRYSVKYGLLTGIIRGEDTFVRGYEPAVVASIQSLRSRWEHAEVKAALARVTLIVIDEAHIQHRHHKELLAHLPDVRVLGLTATPLRDGLGLTYGALVRGPDYEDLIAAKHLVRPRYFIPQSQDIRRGLQGMRVASTGDFVESELSGLMSKKTIIGDCVETWQQKADGRPTIAFCVDRAHSRALCDDFVTAGIAAEHIDMATPEDERAAMFARFRRGETKVLCSINVLAIGFDETSASCAVLARPTLSLSLHIQQVGRVMRPHAGKADCLVLDHAGNVLRHGRVEDFEPPELSEIDKRSDKKRKTEDETDFFPCPSCRALMSPGQRVCHECGHEITRPSTVDFVPAG